MAEELTMPRLSDTMERGTVARWLKHEGDHVAEGDVLAEIETDKATMELSAYNDGVLLKILVGDGEAADLGAPIAIVGEEGETIDDVDGAAPSQPAAAEMKPEGKGKGKTEAKAELEVAEAAADDGATSDATPAADSGNGLRASPIARRMAMDEGIDLRPYAGRGSGPDGRIVRVDVERLIAGTDEMEPAAARVENAPPAEAATRQARAPEKPAAAAPPMEGETIEPTTMLKAVARRMAEAKATVPHFYIQADVDMEAAMAARAELNRGLEPLGEKVSVNDLIVRACALALIEHPRFHRSWVDGKLVKHADAHIGIAVALDDGLIVPVLRSANTRGLRDVARDARDLTTRAREGKLRQSEIEGGTFTVSNLGMLGVVNFAAIINPPEPGILAVGATSPRAIVVDGAVQVRSTMSMTLSVDHRATSGAEGARLLATIGRLLENPLLLLVG